MYLSSIYIVTDIYNQPKYINWKTIILKKYKNTLRSARIAFIIRTEYT